MAFTSDQIKRWETFLKDLALRSKSTTDSDTESLPDINEDEMCSICLESVLTDYRRTVCRHVFHTTCITQWRENSRLCPNCR